MLLTGFSQAASLNLSASEIDFGTQFLNQTSLNLPRYLYLSNNSALPISHAAVSLPASLPFTITDRCPTTLDPHTVCQLQLDYLSSQISADSITLSLDQGLSVLVTGKTLPQPGVNAATVNPNLTVIPSTIIFPNQVVVTNTSPSTQTVTVSNTGTQPFPHSLSLTGDFTDSTNCAAVLGAGASCSVILTFAPSQPGARQGLLIVTAGAGTTPVYVNLSGTGTPILSTNNSVIDFGDVVLNQPVIQWYKLAQPLNQLTAATLTPDFSVLLVEDIGYGHGNPPISAFSATANGTCFNCWIGIAFRPFAPGIQNTTLSISSNSSGNPYTLNLTGDGIPLAGLLLTPIQSDFGPVPINSTSASKIFTLTNEAGGVRSKRAIAERPSSRSRRDGEIAGGDGWRNATTARNHAHTSGPSILYAVPAVILIFYRKRLALPRLLAILLSAILLGAIGCGSGGGLNNNSNLRYTPPGSYQYRVTATSTTGVQLTETVTLNLTVTAQ